MNQIKAGVILNYVIIGLNTLLGLLYTPYMLRMLGQNEYGLYSLVASVIAYLTILDFGFGSAIVRYTAKYRAEDKIEEQWNLFGLFLIVYTLIGILALCTGLLLYFNVGYLFSHTMTSDEIGQAKIMILLLIFNLAITFPLSIFGSIITAYEDFVFQKIVNIIRIVLSTLTIVLLLYFGYKAIAIVVVQTIFNVSTLLLNYLFCKYKLHIKIRCQNLEWGLLKEICIYSFWIFLNSIMDRIYWSTGQFVIGSLIGTAAVAIYSAAILLQSMYMQFSSAVCGVLFPKLTKMVAKNSSNQEISNEFIKAGRIQCVIMALVLSGFIIFGKNFISLWAGNDYGDSYMIALIFFVALFVPMLQNTGIMILAARNQMKFRSTLYVIIAAISLIFQILFTKNWGPIGCAYAIGGALILGQGIIMNFYYSIKQHIDIIRFWKEIIKMLIGPVVLTILGYIIKVNFPNLNWTELILIMTIYAVIFGFVMWNLSLNSYERNLLRAPIAKLLKSIY